MMENTRKEYLQTRFAQEMMDEQTLQALAACETPEQCRQMMNDHNIDVSLDEVYELMNAGNQAIAANNAEHDELSENELETVAGGGKFLRFAVSAAGAVIVGLGAGLATAFGPGGAAAGYYMCVGYAGVVTVWVKKG